MMINNTKINVSFIIEKVSLNKNGTLQEYDYSVLKKRAFGPKIPGHRPNEVLSSVNLTYIA